MTDTHPDLTNVDYARLCEDYRHAAIEFIFSHAEALDEHAGNIVSLINKYVASLDENDRPRAAVIIYAVGLAFRNLHALQLGNWANAPHEEGINPILESAGFHALTEVLRTANIRYEDTTESSTVQ